MRSLYPALLTVFINWEFDSEDISFISDALATPLPLPPPALWLLWIHNTECNTKHSNNITITEKTSELVSSLRLTSLIPKSVENLVAKSDLILGGYSRPQNFFLRSLSSNWKLDIALKNKYFLELVDLSNANNSFCVQNIIKQNKFFGTWLQKNLSH